MKILFIMDKFYDSNIDRDKLNEILNDCQLQMDKHLSKALYYKYLAQQTRSLILLHGFELPKAEEIQTISIDKQIPKVTMYDDSMHPSLKKLSGKKLDKALELFAKYYVS